MARGAEYALAYAHALGAAGADLLSGGDSPAGLLGPRLYEQIALPAERALISRIKAATGAMKQPFTVKCVSLNGKKLAPGAWQTGPGQVEVNLPATARRLNLAFSRNRCGG